MQEGGDRAIRSVAVLGGGIVALSAALAFAGAIPQLAITVIDTPPDPAALADRLPGTLPAIHRFHAMIGVEEEALIRAGAATHRLATRYENWSSDGSPWYHFSGETGFMAGSVPFHQIWSRLRRIGAALPWHRYAAAGVLAEAGKFVHPLEDPRSLLSTYDYALRLDPPLYRAELLTLATRRGVTVTSGAFGGVARGEDGRITGILLVDGRTIEADLYLDCAGPAAPLLGALDDTFDDWGLSLPCNNVSFGVGRAERPEPCDTVRGEPSGWSGSVGLLDRTLLTRCSAGEPDIGDGVETVKLRTGRRRSPWCGNVLGLGDAAIALDPLGSLNLHLAHRAITLALSLLPGRDFHPIEVAEYNRRAAQEAGHARDYVAMLYANGPARTGLLNQSKGLTEVLDQFHRRGRLVRSEGNPITSEEWIAALLGAGIDILPNDALSDAVDADSARAAMKTLSEDLALIPPRLPHYSDYLAAARPGPHGRP